MSLKDTFKYPSLLQVLDTRAPYRARMQNDRWPSDSFPSIAVNFVRNKKTAPQPDGCDAVF